MRVDLHDPGVQEESLAEQLVAGSLEALSDAYRLWSPLVHSIALRSLGDPHDAEDVTQQVFVSAWNGRHTLRPEQGSLAAWLVGITKHRVADVRTQRFRAHRNLNAVASYAATETFDPHDDCAERCSSPTNSSGWETHAGPYCGWRSSRTDPTRRSPGTSTCRWAP